MKREAAKANLQAVTSGHILTANDLFNWASTHIQNVKFFFVSSEQVTANTFQQETRFNDASRVSGTRSHHCFIPHEDGKTLLVKRVSGEEPSFETVLFEDTGRLETAEQIIQLHHCEIGKECAFTQDGKWWIGLIWETSESEGDDLISLMHLHGPAMSF